MARKKTVEEKKLKEWKKMEKKFLGKIRKDKKRNEGKKVRKEEVKCFKYQEKGHFMNNCKSKEWVKRKISKKKKGKEQYLNCREKNVQENSNEEMEVQENSNEGMEEVQENSDERTEEVQENSNERT